MIVSVFIASIALLQFNSIGSMGTLDVDPLSAVWISVAVLQGCRGKC